MSVYSYGVAGAVVLVAAVWLGTGTFVNGGNGPGNGEKPIVALIERDGGPLTQTLEDAGLLHHTEHEIDPHLTIAERVAQESGNQTTLRSVRVETYAIRPMPLNVPLRGRTQAKSTVTVTPQTSGIVEKVLVTKGQTVAAGDIICTIDQGTRAAAVAQAEAALAQAQTAFDTNASLREKGLSPANTALQFEAALKQAQVALDNALAEFNRTEVKTQVAGVVQDPLASVGSQLNPGQPCATVVELNPMLFVGSVPEARVALARIGLPASIETVTGQTLEGKVSYISSTANESTRSFPVEIEIPNADGKVLSGITATATVNLGTVPAHLLPQSVLTLDDKGALGVRAVEDGVVHFYAVTILSDTREGIWVSGLPASVDVITVGQDFVQEGEKVEAGKADAKAEGVAT